MPYSCKGLSECTKPTYNNMYSTGPLELESLSSPQPEFQIPDIDGHISTFTNTLLLHRLLVTGQVQGHPEKNTFLFQDLDRYNHFRPFCKIMDRSGLFGSLGPKTVQNGGDSRTKPEIRDTTHSQMLGKFEYTRGPIFKVVLEC